MHSVYTSGMNNTNTYAVLEVRRDNASGEWIQDGTDAAANDVPRWVWDAIGVQMAEDNERVNGTVNQAVGSAWVWRMR